MFCRIPSLIVTHYAFKPLAYTKGSFKLTQANVEKLTHYAFCGIFGENDFFERNI